MDEEILNALNAIFRFFIIVSAVGFISFFIWCTVDNIFYFLEEKARKKNNAIDLELKQIKFEDKNKKLFNSEVNNNAINKNASGTHKPFN